MAQRSVGDTYHAIWDSLQVGDVFECVFTSDLQRFIVEKRFPTGVLVCRWCTFPPLRGFVMEPRHWQCGYIRYLGYAVERRFLWWRWYTIRYAER
jgi:hypothetical protein